MRSTAPLSMLVAVVASTIAGCPKPSSDVPDVVFGHCIYVNRFSDLEECREFRGDGWTTAAAQESCDEYDVDVADGPCPYAETQGACVTSSDAQQAVQLVIPGSDDGACASNQRGCELFGGGTWVDGSVCSGSTVDVDDFYDPDASFYVPEVRECREPLPGEPPGQSEGGQVCTWGQISGCTEEGRNFSDYASCEDVLTQRPYSPVPPNDTQPLDDPRLQDPVYVDEVNWVKQQVESCACVCCHQGSITPEGAGIWDTEAPGNWVNTFTDWGIGFSAGAFDSSLLGSFASDENNGFSRFTAGLPSTDEPRMKRFFERELEHRGLTVADFADEPPAPFIFYEQATYEPGPCADGEGVDDDGVVRWTGGRARYLYVLAAGSANPGVPPNLDKPDGTLWRVDTVPPAIPMKTGEVVYGALSEGTKQSVPGPDVDVTALVAGESYLLFALADIGVPVTRCVFTFGG